MTYTIKYFEYVEYSSPLTRQDVIDLGVIQEQRDGIFYDLLPIGTTVDAASITAKHIPKGGPEKKSVNIPSNRLRIGKARVERC